MDRQGLKRDRGIPQDVHLTLHNTFRRLRVDACGYPSCYKLKKWGVLYQSMLDYPFSCSLIKAWDLALQASVLNVPDLLKVLLDPPYFLKDCMLLGVDATKS